MQLTGSVRARRHRAARAWWRSRLDAVPARRRAAVEAQSTDGAVAGTVWLDFAPGGGGEAGVIDPTEKGLPGVDVEAVSDGEVVASATTATDGTFALEGIDGDSSSVCRRRTSASPSPGSTGWVRHS